MNEQNLISIDNIRYQFELREILTKDGRSMPRRYCQEYLNKYGKSHLVKWVESLYPSPQFNFGDSCKAILKDVFKVFPCDTCGCTVTSWAKLTNSWRRFCSNDCRNNDPNISELKKAMWTDENKKSGVESRKVHYMEKYGVEHNMQIPEVAIKSGLAIKASRALRTESEKIAREKSYRESRMPDTFHLVEDKEWLFDQYVTKELSVNSIAGKFNISGEAVKNAIIRHEIPYTPEREYSLYVSSEEQEFYEFIKNIRQDAIQTFRNGYELDVYIPELKLGFEYNGCYFHSEGFKGKEYHQSKVNHFNKHGIKVIQIWSDSWLNNKTRTQNFIRNIISPGKTIGARKCNIQEITTTEYTVFLDEMHMQGASGASVRYGLFYEGILKSVMGFKRVASNDSKGGYELCRFANKNVVGGFSKLLKEFLRNYSNVDVYSFADLETVCQENNVYLKNGFVEVDRVNIDYKYFNRRSKLREHKFGWRKKAFEKLGYDIGGKTEVDLAIEAGLLKCWDSGKIVYKLLKE